MKILLAWDLFFAGSWEGFSPCCGIGSGSQVCSSVGGCTWLALLSPQQHLPLQQGLPSTLGNLGFAIPRLIFTHPGLLLPKWGEQREGLCWGSIPEPTLHPQLLLKEAGVRNNWRNDSICFCRTHFRNLEFTKWSAWMHVLLSVTECSQLSLEKMSVINFYEITVYMQILR